MSHAPHNFESEASKKIDETAKVHWLRLIRTPRVGPRIFRKLFNAYSSAEEALEALPYLAAKADRKYGVGNTPLVPTNLSLAEEEIEQGEVLGAKLLAFGEPGFPSLLRFIDDFPPLLWVKGNPNCLKRPCVSIVGSRNASAIGRKFARSLAKDLADAEITVTSGLARGIDTAAHEGSLAGGTIAVLAGGLKKIYPAENAGLAEALTENGLLISEQPPAYVARANDFPKRNRIVSGCSYGVVIVEAALRSGSLITARMAGEQGREVFAVPGFPLDPRAEGANKLIKNGAVLTRSADDILDTILPMLEEPHRPTLTPFEDPFDMSEEAVDFDIEPGESDQARVHSLLSTVATNIDDIIEESGLDARTVRAVLFEMELAGAIRFDHGSSVVLSERNVGASPV